MVLFIRQPQTFDFLFESYEYNNTAEEQVHEIIQYYILIRRRRAKLNISVKETLDKHL